MTSVPSLTSLAPGTLCLAVVVRCLLRIVPSSPPRTPQKFKRRCLHELHGEAVEVEARRRRGPLGELEGVSTVFSGIANPSTASVPMH
jgi:hypothetical protein